MAALETGIKILHHVDNTTMLLSKADEATLHNIDLFTAGFIPEMYEALLEETDPGDALPIYKYEMI